MYEFGEIVMTDITELTKTVIDTLRSTQEYIDYADRLAVLKADPVLYNRVNELREKNFNLHQSDMDPGDLMDCMDALTNEYEDVINNGSVAAFMEAEAAICTLVREFNLTVTEGLDFD